MCVVQKEIHSGWNLVNKRLRGFKEAVAKLTSHCFLQFISDFFEFRLIFFHFLSECLLICDLIHLVQAAIDIFIKVLK